MYKRQKLSFDEDGKVIFKIPNTDTSNISLFIEGTVNDSKLISQEIKIEPKN